MSTVVVNPPSAIRHPKSMDAVLLISFGGPETPDEIRPFLDVVLKGRPVPPERVEEVVKHYEAIGGISPLNRITFQQAGALESLLKEVGPAVPVRVGMRNWRPFLRDVLSEMGMTGHKRVLAIILAAHRSEPSIDRYLGAVKEASSQAGPTAPQVEFAPAFFDHPMLAEALADLVQEAVRGWRSERRKQAAWVMTAHSIPEAAAEASTYVQDLQATCQGVAERLALPAWRLAYQSRSGGPREPWLGPDVREVIREEAKAGKRDLVLIPVGFVADHVEVLYDLDIDARAVSREAGVTLVRTPTVGDHPKFIAMLASMVRRRFQGSQPA